MRQYRQIDKPSRDTTHTACNPEANVMADFCRGCLTIHEKPAELLQYTEKNRRLYFYSTGIQVKRNDAIMFQLCKDCYVNMLMSCKFKKQCKTSEKKFKHYVSLKEAGDAFDISSFLKTNEEPLRFPSLSGSSTPANQRIRDDDNESTCTSIRNFMSDILQGEEMPDSEARIIKEVIEEETDILDDSLDSQWLQDDISIDTDFRLDFSFSPFSTPQSTNIDHCYTPNKTIDTGMSNFKCVTGKNIVQLPIDRRGKYKQSTKQYTAQLQTAQETPETTDVVKESTNQKDDNDDDEERESLFNEIIDQNNVNYVTQNENDIAITTTQDDNNRNESYYAAQTLQNDNNKYYASRDSEQNNKFFSALKEKQMAVENILESNNDASSCNQSNYFSSHNNMAVKNIDQNMVNNNQSEITFTLKHESGDIVVKVNEMTSDDKQTNHNTEDKSRSTGEQKDVLSNRDINDDTKYEHTQTLCKHNTTVTTTDKETEKKNDILKEALNNKNNKEFNLDDMLISPTAYPAVPGASTPTINNILFGDKYDLDEDNNKTMKTDNFESENKMDVLDEMLKKGVKEFNIHSQESLAADVYDLGRSYCKTCDKKFKSAKALKVHLTKVHGIKLPRVKSRDFDKQTRICPVCAASYNDYRNYMRHVKSHAETQKDCSKCKLTFSSEGMLKLHMKSHVALQPVDKEIKPKKYLCTICGHSTDVSGNFTIHMKRHARKYVARCAECGRGFYRKTELEHHLRIHTGELPFPCKHCDKCFRRKYGLIKHMRVHLSERPFQCEHCSKKFILRSDIVNHLKKSRLCMKARAGLEPKRDPPPKKYECFYCNDKFTNKSNFIKHQKNYQPCKTLHMQNRLKIDAPKVVLPVLTVANNVNNVAKTVI